MVKRSLKEHLIVFVISITLFSMGVLIGLTSSRIKSGEIESRINDFENNLNELQVGFLLSEAINDKEVSCNYLNENMKRIRINMEAIGEVVVNYEEASKIQDPYYLILKKQYTSVRAQYWVLLERLKNECTVNYNTILYFYKTSQPCPDCRDQGVILSHLSSKDAELYVVPVDADEDLLIISAFKQAFNITEAPAIVINSKLIRQGLISSNELIELLTSD